MKPDVEKYVEMLGNMDLSHDHKVELVYDLWRIMEHFVDEAWGLPHTQYTDNNSSQRSGGNYP